MLEIKDFVKYPSCCMVCPMRVIYGTHFCRYLDKHISDEKKRMDDCPFVKMEKSMKNTN